MAENKTQPTDADVGGFLASVENDTRRMDARTVCELMSEISGEEPTMWGSSIVGFGSMTYRGKSGREGNWFLIGFSPRKQALTLYLTQGTALDSVLLDRLGKHRTGVGCLYINKLSDVDHEVLRELVKESFVAARG